MAQLDQLNVKVTSGSSQFVCSPRAATVQAVRSAPVLSIAFETVHLIVFHGFLIVLIRMYVFPGQLLCPDSPCLGSEKWNSASSSGKAPPARQGVPLKGTPQETAENGYNTNYATSWHLVRTAPIFRGSGGGGATTVGGLKDWYSSSGAQNCVGPLTVRALDNGDVPANALPFIGCATQGDVDQSSFQGDGILPETISESLGLVAGSPAAESFNDGPAFSDGASAVRLVGSGTDMRDFQVAFTNKGEVGQANVILQDTRDWFAYHAKSVNIVFADGSVRALEDTNGDGFINPGFAVDPATASFVNTGYTSSETEVEPWEMFSGTFLREPGATKKFEN